MLASDGVQMGRGWMLSAVRVKGKSLRGTLKRQGLILCRCERARGRHQPVGHGRVDGKAARLITSFVEGYGEGTARFMRTRAMRWDRTMIASVLVFSFRLPNSIEGILPGPGFGLASPG